MDFKGFNQNDFNVFQLEGLDNRMSAIKDHIQPKFEALATTIEPTLTSLSGDEMYTHIARHARRTVNPPNDTWVAFANNKRGYKMLPHFQVGLFDSHVFVWFAVIYECPIKASFAELLLKHPNKWLKEIPKDFVWSTDHMKPDALKHGDLKKQDLIDMFTKLKEVKKAELLCGIHINRDEQILQNGPAFVDKIEQTFKILTPLYNVAKKSAVTS
ncbi:hypothetical protein BTS2_0815 [Bacillus sp. TS-2]|nr:hypothetical protein BTS2_0815 [Bacillus sp. TS-2]